jgi:hypothetical protein
MSPGIQAHGSRIPYLGVPAAEACAEWGIITSNPAIHRPPTPARTRHRQTLADIDMTEQSDLRSKRRQPIAISGEYRRLYARATAVPADPSTPGRPSRVA